MGDSSKIVENDVLNKYDLNNIDVLKVGHHGSNTSSCKEFIEKINTKYSVISVGENNRYNHPNKDVLDNLKNSYVLRTDVNGSIMFEIKNNSLRVECFSLTIKFTIIDLKFLSYFLANFITSFLFIIHPL